MSVRRPTDHAVPASFGRRVAAVLVDLVLLLLASGLGAGVVAALGATGVVAVSVGRDGGPGAQVSPALVLSASVVVGLLVLVQWLLHGLRGWTVGRRLLGVRTLDVETRLPVGPWRVLVRAVVVVAGGLVLGVGSFVVLLSPLFDRTGRLRGWHDLAARAEVLDVRGAGEDLVPVRAWAVPPLPHATGVAGAPVGPGSFPPVAAGAPVTGPVAVVPGGDTRLVLAPLAPARQGPDLDTRAMPIVRPVTLAFGLHPELEVTRPSRERLPVPVPEVVGTASGATRVAAELELTDGRRVTVTRSALVGRNPAAEGDVQLIRVVDPSRSVSKTHLQIGVEPGGVWVADRGSTNGTVVTLPDGAQIVCGTDQQVRLRVGATVAFGDHGLRLLRAPGTAAAS
ncbi:FHA domain-containing protein [Cellulomonas soli]|uniref:FHA domain-containing protein n=1 Tax=Cellulomonas soli TaxID=931535 RepID=A0A512PD98_9CELL|nr:FHA domain-containing protein [Cellulomonas soli]NYI60158.1 hypothetical protein [Cellulomonas soli]GEP69189.1 hypothetical protein CSO01_19040 [Cellulomonas soli]